ncbi:MAG: hypothetical protein JWP89_4893 [Schlesneria sp.]|nr:hypothetical protein [Schlesneria sp.]
MVGDARSAAASGETTLEILVSLRVVRVALTCRVETWVRLSSFLLAGRHSWVGSALESRSERVVSLRLESRSERVDSRA